MHELDADYSEGTSLCVHSPSYASPKSFLCFPAGAGDSYTISALCCKVRVRNSFSISRLRTLSFSVSCNPCICHSYENCRVCTNNSHSGTRRRELPPPWRKNHQVLLEFATVRSAQQSLGLRPPPHTCRRRRSKTKTGCHGRP